MMQDFLKLIEPTLLPVSGRTFYSGRAAFSRPSNLYFLGLNPGGDPIAQASETIARDAEMLLSERPEAWSAYVDESWRGVAAGTKKLQRRVRETGMRLNEALSLEVSDIRPDRSSATLRRGVKRNKNGLRVRTIDLTDGARAVLTVINAKAGRVFSNLHESSAVVGTRYGQWCRQRQGREDRAAKVEGREPSTLCRFRLHDLRHAFAVASMVRDVACSYRLQLHLGHSTITTTERYSGHVQREGYNRGPTTRGWFGTLYGWLPNGPAHSLRQQAHAVV